MCVPQLSHEPTLACLAPLASILLLALLGPFMDGCLQDPPADHTILDILDFFKPFVVVEFGLALHLHWLWVLAVPCPPSFLFLLILFCLLLLFDGVCLGHNLINITVCTIMLLLLVILIC